MASAPWRRHNAALTSCRRCPRLVAWRESVAAHRTRRFAEEEYWGRPVPGSGDSSARLLIVGLAPAAHGANRTGRMFTGDRSGDWLYEALHRFGFANQPTSIDRNDGLRLQGCFVTAACRCAPPDNKPTKEEMAACRPFFEWEVGHLPHVQIILGLGKIGFDAAATVLDQPLSSHVARTPMIEGPLDKLATLRRRSTDQARRRSPQFSHGASVTLENGLILMGSYHPSQQNTFTGRLTRPMFHAIFRRIRTILDRS
ncbi:MAG: uracil-DNA glycosylase [Bacteroidetes bacterium]|nr:uracil-DNA glycosylase [Bacteroidota bacterium]